MSQSAAAAEAARQAHNARMQAEAAQWQEIANKRQEEYNKKQDELERLKEAQKQLVKPLDHLEGFSRRVTEYSSKISDSDFRGDVRDRINEILGQMSVKIKEEQNQQEKNKETLDQEIKKREEAQEVLKKSIQSAIDSRDLCLASMY